MMARFYLKEILPVLLCFIHFITLIPAQSDTCKQEKIFRALQSQVENGSDIFCQQYLASLSYIGTLRQDPTFFFYETFTDTKSTDVVYKYKEITTREVVTSTSFESQKRSPITTNTMVSDFRGLFCSSWNHASDSAQNQ